MTSNSQSSVFKEVIDRVVGLNLFLAGSQLTLALQTNGQPQMLTKRFEVLGESFATDCTQMGQGERIRVLSTIEEYVSGEEGPIVQTAAAAGFLKTLARAVVEDPKLKSILRDCEPVSLFIMRDTEPSLAAEMVNGLDL